MVFQASRVNGFAPSRNFGLQPRRVEVEPGTPVVFLAAPRSGNDGN